MTMLHDETPRNLDRPQTEPPMPASGMEWGLALGGAAAAGVVKLVL
jgi:hypothetical protein